MLADCLPEGVDRSRPTGPVNLFHIGVAFAVQYTIGLVVQRWIPEAGHYPENAYQTAFALIVVCQIAAWIWFMIPRALPRPLGGWQPQPSET